jgi:hypothetical protein
MMNCKQEFEDRESATKTQMLAAIAMQAIPGACKKADGAPHILIQIYNIR